MNTKIIACTCKSAFQDERYGLRNRVHNAANGKKVWRCTVCKVERSMTGEEISSSDKKKGGK